LATIQKSKEAEIAKLLAQKRKSDMMEATKQRELEQKIQENRELTQICDDLIAKVGN
jgi:hypothetical protein